MWQQVHRFFIMLYKSVRILIEKSTVSKRWDRDFTFTEVPLSSLIIGYNLLHMGAFTMKFPLMWMVLCNHKTS